jgi:hypothetical protein
MKDQGYGTQHCFLKKDGTAKGYSGQIQVDAKEGDWCEITVDEMNNWTLTSVKKLPSGGGKGGYKIQPYHPETAVSNWVGQAIIAGAIKQPQEIETWAISAANAFLAAKKIVTGEQVGESQNTGRPNTSTRPASGPDYDNNVPLDAYEGPIPF